MIFDSRATVLLHVSRGLPGSLPALIKGFHSIAFLAINFSSLQRVWPIYPHFWRLIRTSTGSMLPLCRRHRLTKICSRDVTMLVTFQLQQPYNSTENTFDLNSLSFRPVLALRQTGDKIPKADPTFLIRISMSKSVPPLASISLPRYVNLSTASICSPPTGTSPFAFRA